MRLTREHRLLKRQEFRALTARGSRSRTRFFTMVHGESRNGKTRLGMGVSRKVGNAVARNKLRRRLREIFRARMTGDEGLDLLFIARPGAAELDFAALQREFDLLLRRSKQTRRTR